MGSHEGQWGAGGPYSSGYYYCYCPVFLSTVTVVDGPPRGSGTKDTYLGDVKLWPQQTARGMQDTTPQNQWAERLSFAGLSGLSAARLSPPFLSLPLFLSSVAVAGC